MFETKKIILLAATLVLEFKAYKTGNILVA